MEEFVPITPVNFFQLRADCFRVKQDGPLDLARHKLPDTSALCAEKHFAEVAVGWSPSGITCRVAARTPIMRVSFPEVMRGESVELFLDTRDVKTSGFNTRFCHHFFFLPEAVEGVQAGELTRFRTEDAHPLCDPGDLIAEAKKTSHGYDLHIFIPAHCLHGYEPEQFNRLGFNYRINATRKDPQHFCGVTDDVAIEQQPSLWSSLRLIP